MNEHQIRSIAPRASRSFIEANRSTPPAVMERSSGVRPLATKKAEDRHTERYVVRVTSYRRRLVDEDNLCEKYHVDSCRYAGLLPSDAPDKAHIIVAQKKVKTKDQEKTLIEIT